jgi:hypothetical protein
MQNLIDSLVPDDPTDLAFLQQVTAEVLSSKDLSVSTEFIAKGNVNFLEQVI